MMTGTSLTFLGRLRWTLSLPDRIVVLPPPPHPHTGNVVFDHKLSCPAGGAARWLTTHLILFRSRPVSLIGRSVIMIWADWKTGAAACSFRGEAGVPGFPECCRDLRTCSGTRTERAVI